MFNFFKINKRKKVDEDILRLTNKINRMLLESKIFNKRITVDIFTAGTATIYPLYTLMKSIQGTSNESDINKLVSDFMECFNHCDVELVDLKNRADVRTEEDDTFESSIYFTLCNLKNLLALYKLLKITSIARKAIINEDHEKSAGDMVIHRVCTTMLSDITQSIRDLEYNYSLFFDLDLTVSEMQFIDTLKENTKNIDEFILNCYFNNTFLGVHGMDSKTVKYESLTFDEDSVKFTYISSDKCTYNQVFVYPKAVDYKESYNQNDLSRKLSAIFIMSKYTEITKNEE